MAFYKLPPEDVTDLVNEVIHAHHPRLVENEVTVDVLMAFASENGFAILVRGVPAYASAKIIRHMDRVAGFGDCRITIDGDQWPHFPVETQRAIIDHELTHFELQRDKRTDKVKIDETGRPKLRMRQHDHDLGWYDEVVQRHGNYSIEAMQYRQLQEIVKQRWLFKDMDEQLKKSSKKGRR